MKKNTSKKLAKRLAQYGALSAAVLGVADATGQVTYTDVNPDIILDLGDTFDIDFTGAAGQANVQISNPDGLAGGTAALAFPSSGGALVGFTAGGYEYPLVLVDGDVIDDASGYTTPGVRGDLNYYGCAYSNSQWCDFVEDGILGVSFQFDGNTHYGWVRMDTDVGADDVITVKGYAFEATPDTAIVAGDEGTLGNNDNNLNGFAHFVTDGQLNLKANTAMSNVAVFDITGKQVISQNLTSTNAQVNLAGLNTGVYIAKVSIEGSEESFKFVK
tara:strand:- start:54 stop:872 length:819 start_codon:yes stop_codon:yes gene_type:complete